MRPRIRDHEKLGLCPVRELVRMVCPGPAEPVGRCLTVGDVDLLMRWRHDRFDWLGRIRLIEAQRPLRLSDQKAISYGVLDYALRSSALADFYDGTFVISDYADVPRPDPHDRKAIEAWVLQTFENGAAVNGERLPGWHYFIEWLVGGYELGPFEFKTEHRNVERAIRRAA